MNSRISKSFWLVALALILCTGLSAQQAIYLRLNEVMTENVDNYQDDYGKHSPWIEIYNDSPGSVDLGGCYLTTDINNPKMYSIPKGDIMTKVKPRQHIIFWADKMPERGTFHLNFTFDPTTSNFLAIFDSNGSTLIDSVTIPPMMADKTWARSEDGKFGVWQVANKVTPSTNNIIKSGNEAVEKFKDNDPNGVGMSITAMMVVFGALCILFLVFKSIGNIAISLSKRNAAKLAGTPVKASPSDATEASGEVMAAIAMALYEYNNEAHDLENTVLTINRVTRNYSPWSSKIYGLRDVPKKN